MGAVAATAATLGLVATTTGAEAAYCAHWRHGYCVDWRNNGYTYDPGAAAALNAFAGVMGAAVAASQPRYYYPPPPAYYAPAPVYVEPACHWVRERFWDGYGWRFRRVQVCD